MKKRILFVDDDVLLARALKRIYSRHGYDTVVAGNSKEALVCLATERFDLIVSDSDMDYGGEGIVFLSGLPDGSPPAILHSSHDAQSVLAYCRSRGLPEDRIRHIVVKADVDGLRGKIREIIGDP